MNIKKTIKAILPNCLQPLFERIEASPLGYRLAKSAFWSLAGAIIARGLGLASSIFVARMLGKSGFGELGIIHSTVGMLGTFAGFGLGMTATKFIAQYRRTDPIKAGHIRALSSAFAWVTSGTTSLIMFIMAPWLAEHTLAAPQMAGLLKIGSVFLFFTAINGAQIGALSGFEAFKTVARINLWCGIANFLLMVGGVYVAGLSGAACGMVVTAGINLLLNHAAIRRECSTAGIPYTYAGCWREKSVLWKFAFPAMVSGLFFAPTEWALNAMLVNQPGGYSEMGLFNAAKQWHVLILYVPLAISNMTLPILSNLIGEGNLHQYKKMVVANTLLLSSLALLVALPVAAFSRFIMGAYGPDFIAGQDVLLLVCIYSVLWASNIVFGQVLWSTGSSRLAMILAALRAAFLVGSFAFFLKRDAYGLAIAYTITYTLLTIYQSGLSLRIIKNFRKASYIDIN